MELYIQWQLSSTPWPTPATPVTQPCSCHSAYILTGSFVDALVPSIQRKKARAADTGERQPPTFTLLISNLKRDLDVETVVWEFFERHNVAVSKVKPIGHSGARAKVTVATDEDVMKACSLHRCMLAGRPINVERGGPDSATDESAAALQRAQMEMAKSQLSEFGLLRLEEDDQLVRHLAYHNKDTVHKALACVRSLSHPYRCSSTLPSPSMTLHGL